MKRSQQIFLDAKTEERLKRLGRAQKRFASNDARAGEESLGLEALIDEHELVPITGRSLGSVRRDRLLGQGCPYIKLHGLVRYRPSDVRMFIESNLRCGNKKEGR